MGLNILLCGVVRPSVIYKLESGIGLEWRNKDEGEKDMVEGRQKEALYTILSFKLLDIQI